MTVDVYIARGRPAKEDVLDKTYETLQALNDSQGLDFAQTKEDATGVAISVFFVTGSTPQLGVRLSFDLELDFSTFTLACEDPECLQMLRAALDAKIGFETSQSLLDQAQKELSPRALVRLSRGFVLPQDTRVMKLLRQGFKADTANLRRAAALALLNLKWVTLMPELQSAFEHEVDPNARETMAYALNVMR